METFTFDFTFEPDEGDGCECCAHVEVYCLEGDDWAVERIEEIIEPSYWRPHAGGGRLCVPAKTALVAKDDPRLQAMYDAAGALAPHYIERAYDRGEIGPAARAAMQADYRRDMAEADRMERPLLIASPTMLGRA